MLRGKTGFGGTTPCAQTAGDRKFYKEFQNPLDLLLNGDYRHIPIFFGANSHEGSFIYQSKLDIHVIFRAAGPVGYSDIAYSDNRLL